MGTFDLIFCDLAMPEMSGTDFYREIKRSYPQYLSRIIFMTGGAYTAEAQQFLLELDRQWIEKPFAARQLKSIVAEALSLNAEN